jgi:hypothetical protein
VVSGRPIFFYERAFIEQDSESRSRRHPPRCAGLNVMNASPTSTAIAALAAIQRIGFGEVERTKYSRFGSREDDTVSVRCSEEKGLVLSWPPAGSAPRPMRCSSIFNATTSGATKQPLARATGLTRSQP